MDDAGRKEQGISRDDEFQRRLRELGYLANPLDKFFIGGARGRTGVVVANVKIAAKVGVLGGVFLGLVTAFGLELVSAGTVERTAKLAAYFAAIFTVLFTVLELVICLVATALGRIFRRLFTRTEMIALYSSVFAGLVAIVYGTLWWWALAPAGRFFTAGSAAALAVVAALAAVVALLTRAAVTALLAQLGGADLEARGKGRATKLYFAVLVLAVVVFAGYRLATTQSVPEEPSPYEKRRSDLSVTLVALDGACYRMLEYMADSGKCPNFQRLLSSGFSAALVPPELHVNPSVWTTVATGVGPGKHGVVSYGGQEIPGLGLYIRDSVGFGLYDALLSALPAVGLSRRAPLERGVFEYPALWDILARKGELAGVVNWWGTWPAAGFHGFLVTDRMYPKLQAARAISMKPAYEAEAFPEGLFNVLSDYEVASSNASPDSAAAADMDRFAVEALRAGESSFERLSFTAVYLPGLDVYENGRLSANAAAGQISRAVELVEGTAAYWQFLDGLLGPVLERAGAGHVVMLAGDPGMLKGDEKSERDRQDLGFIVVAGGPARRGESHGPFALVDIAPAVLYLLGFPISAEMDGRMPTEAFDEAFVAAHPAGRVDTFGRVPARGSAFGGKYSVDSELVSRLRSLGYLQ